MSLIRQVSKAVQASNGVVDLEVLSRQLNIQPTALRAIIAFCAQKGVLNADGAVLSNQDNCSDSGTSACQGCSFAAGCK